MGAFVHGLVFGLGFAISLVGLVATAMFAVPWDKFTGDQSTEMVQEMMAEMSSVEGIEVLSHEKHARGKDVVVLGRIKNGGKTTRSNYALEVELFAGEKFVELCRESFFGSIRAGEERNFKVTCHSCRGASVPEHDRYEVRVTE